MKSAGSPTFVKKKRELMDINLIDEKKCDILAWNI